MNMIKKSLLGACVLLFASSAYAQAAWNVTNNWESKTAEAGVAWSANSGLTWTQKFSEWVRSLKKIAREAGGSTFELKDPTGKTTPSMVVDCADTAMALRVLFSQWYGLPFMFRAGNQSIGHWGVKNAITGAAIGYISGLLKNRTVGGVDEQIASIGGKLGNYLDKVLTNKNAGHLIVHLLSNAGSSALAGETNVYNIVPRALRAGDMGIERWQADGIGHTVPVKNVEAPGTKDSDSFAVREQNLARAAKYNVEVIQGWLPPRQAIWGDSVEAQSLFSDHLFGGPECVDGEGATCKTYASIGGGIKRWRVAKIVGGVWKNTVPASDTAIYIKGSDFATLGKRTGEFEALINLPGKEELLTALLRRIGEKRRSLAEKPSGCGARVGREEAFQDLYALMQEEWRMSQAQVDAKYRKTIDYVWRPLDYSKSSTCCWNSSTAAMGASVVTQALAAVRANGANCKAPAVFMKANNRYEPYQAGAGQTPWATYKNDENCPQGASPTDAVDPAAFKATDYCAAKPWLNDATPEVQ